MLNIRQQQELLKPLSANRVAKRKGAGTLDLSYLEAYEVKAHLIRIFGFGGWSWNVTDATLMYEEKLGANWSVGYKVLGTLHIAALDCTYSEAVVGSGMNPQRGESHDMAVKTGESDALKRAAINLGTQFGLSLYNNGSLRDVVGGTLDGDGTMPDIPPVAVTEAPVAISQDSEGADIWIESMKAAVADKDISSLLAIKKEMNEEGVNDFSYQGVTLAKWLDKAIASTSKK
jgi:hypothetical protein